MTHSHFALARIALAIAAGLVAHAAIAQAPSLDGSPIQAVENTPVLGAGTASAWRDPMLTPEATRVAPAIEKKVQKSLVSTKRMVASSKPVSKPRKSPVMTANAVSRDAPPSNVPDLSQFQPAQAVAVAEPLEPVHAVELYSAQAGTPVMVTEVVRVDAIDVGVPTYAEQETKSLPRASTIEPKSVALTAREPRVLERLLGVGSLMSVAQASTTLSKEEKAVAPTDMPRPSPPLNIPNVHAEATIQLPPAAAKPKPIKSAPKPVPTLVGVQKPSEPVDAPQTVTLDVPGGPIVSPMMTAMDKKLHRIANPKWPGVGQTGDFIAFLEGSSRISLETEEQLRTMVGTFREHGIRKLVLQGTALRDEDSEGLEASEFALERARHLKAAFQKLGFKGSIVLDDPKRARPGTTPRVGLTALR